MRNPIVVHKFGGTSLADADRIRRAVKLATDDEHARPIVVVSALGGVTDQLIKAVADALDRTDGHRPSVDGIAKRHWTVATDLLSPKGLEEIGGEFEDLWQDLRELLDGVYLLRECTDRSRDAIVSMGERASARLFAAAVRETGRAADAADATALVATDDTFGEAHVRFDVTRRWIQEWFDTVPASTIPVVTGFIGSTEQGAITTLGRSGSDYTATILADAVNASRVVIWTDVDGVLSADPRLVEGAFTLPQLSYHEAAEMAYFGAKVIHPRTIRPVIRNQVPIEICNSFSPETPGTLISHESVGGHVKSVSAIRDVSVVMLEGTGMVGVPGIAARAFTALADRKINVLMIAQASSEHSICIVVKGDQDEKAVRALKDGFRYELEVADVGRIYSASDLAVVSIIGDSMRQQPGLAGEMFGSLGRSRINVLAIAQGASETNISAVVRDSAVVDAVITLHDTFVLGKRTLNCVIAGVGHVGSALLELLARDESAGGTTMRVIGAMNSRKIVLDGAGMEPSSVKDRLAASDRPAELTKIKEQATAVARGPVLLIDATASQHVAGLYGQLLDSGIGVVTANKIAFARPMKEFRSLMQAANKSRAPFIFETIVGAALPVISTVQSILSSGDRIAQIDCVLSGSVAYIMSELHKGKPLSEVVREVRRLGYSEPDPREDLGGRDFGRKLLILSRLMGHELNMEDVKIESLVPTELETVSIDEYLSALADHDDEWKIRIDEATSRGNKLRYVGHVKNGSAELSLVEVPAASVIGQLEGSDNIVSFFTERYGDSPIVVRGRGAGPTVTAGGMLADMKTAATQVFGRGITW